MAVMCLSKYHGALIIGLVVLSNLSLLKEKYSWLAIFTASLILIPHLLWQIEFDYPSISYHLFDRSSKAYKLNYTLEYIAAQLFVLGPLTGILFFISCAKIKSSNQFERTLKLLFWGGYCFFFIMSFKGRVEGHWTLFVVIPGVYFGFAFIEALERTKKALSVMFCVSILLIWSVRIMIAIESPMDSVLVVKGLVKKYRKREDMLLIKDVAEGRPVAFMNSYANASVYSFYSGSKGLTLNNDAGRRDQYNVWNSEEKIRGKRVMVIPNYHDYFFNLIPNASLLKRYVFVDNFQSFPNINVELLGMPVEVEKSKIIELSVRLNSPVYYGEFIDSNAKFPTHLSVMITQSEDEVHSQKNFSVKSEMFNESTLLNIEAPSVCGVYEVRLNTKTGWLPPSKKSKVFLLNVVENKNMQK